MLYWLIPLCIVLACAIVALGTMLVCFFRIFYAPRKRTSSKEEYPIPKGEIYEAHREQMIRWIRDARAYPYREVSIVSHDGLVLRGKYFEYKKGAPIELLCHGYRGWAERDLSGGVFRCFGIGHSVLTVDHRGCGESEGHVTTFGAKESLDCLRWIDLILKEIDPDARIILSGVSMGASTVMTVAGMENLPKNVVGVLADCGYTSTRAIISKVMRDRNLPPRLLYPFVRFSAILFSGFDPDAQSPIASMAKCHLPIIFFHGDADDFVPHSMSVENYNACVSAHKALVTIKGAGHGIAFPVDQEGYRKAAKDFFDANI